MSRRRQGAETKGDMTPMIDCVFLLLIFFIIAAKFVVAEGHLDIWLPKDTGQANTQSVELEEIQDVRIYIRGGPDNHDDAYSRDIEVALDNFPLAKFDWRYAQYGDSNSPLHDQAKFNDMTKRIHETFTGTGGMIDKLRALKASGVRTNMVINADPNVPYVFVVEAMNACFEAEVSKEEGIKFSAQKRQLQKINQNIADSIKGISPN